VAAVVGRQEQKPTFADVRVSSRMLKKAFCELAPCNSINPEMMSTAPKAAKLL